MRFPAIWTRSQRGQLSADFESVAFPGNTFIFLLKRKTPQCAYFRCAYCAKAMKYRIRRGATHLTVPIVRATLEDGFLDDPDNPLHRHFCIDEEEVDTSTYAAKARYIYNKVKLELMDMPMTPRQAWLQMEAEVRANFPDPVSQQEIIARLPSDKSAKRSFARRSSIGKKNLGFWADGEEEETDPDNQITILEGWASTETSADPDNDPRSLPQDLLKPASARPHWICAPGRERLANYFLLHRDSLLQNRSPFMVFADVMGINLLHKCSDIVCDGNSNFYPRGFAQLYTFHAVHPAIPEEAHLCAFALLPNTAQSSYVRLFDILSDHIVSEFGSQGVRKTWHFDNQYAAITGCRAIFPNHSVRGDSEQRTAEFAQLWHDHLLSLFHVAHPNLRLFVHTMREELQKASKQAERIFRPPPPITSINLDNIDVVKNYTKVRDQGEQSQQHWRTLATNCTFNRRLDPNSAAFKARQLNKQLRWKMRQQRDNANAGAKKQNYHWEQVGEKKQKFEMLKKEGIASSADGAASTSAMALAEEIVLSVDQIVDTQEEMPRRRSKRLMNHPAMFGIDLEHQEQTGEEGEDGQSEQQVEVNLSAGEEIEKEDDLMGKQEKAN